MEFLQGIGSKTGAMPLNNDLMYVFHIRPEAPVSNASNVTIAQNGAEARHVVMQTTGRVLP
jgi:hypothetical protein